MRVRHAQFALAAALSFVGATAFAQDVKTDFDKDANFAAIKTFSRQDRHQLEQPDQREARHRGDRRRRSPRRAGSRSDANPDALVLLHGATEKQKSLNTFYSGGYGGYGYRGWGGMGGMGTATTTTSEYLVGTLVVDIFDAKTKALMFRGTASDEISDKPEKNVKKLEKATDKMFKDFPPGSKEKK